MIKKRGSRLTVFSETIKIVLRNVELEKMTTIKIVPTSEIWPPEAVLRGGVLNSNIMVTMLKPLHQGRRPDDF